MIVPDINLLLYTFNASAPSHSLAVQWWEELLNSERTVGVPWVVLLGFLRLMTGRHVLVAPYTPAEAVGLTEQWFALPNVRLLPSTQHTWRLLSDMIVRYELSGAIVTDAAIAASALEHRAVVHTNDSDFQQFEGLRTHNPLTQ